MIEFSAITVQEIIDIFGELHEVTNIIGNVSINDKDLSRATRKAAEQIALRNAHRELISISIGLWKTPTSYHTGWKSVPNGTFETKDMAL